MSADDAKAPLDRGSGEPLSAYISPDDLKDTIDVVYVDMAAGDAAAQALDDLSDVNLTGQSAADVLTFDGANWVPAAAPTASPIALDDLTDVSVANPGVSEVLGWSGSAWVPQSKTATSEAGVYNVATYGATGNGTTDDTAAIQAAIAAAGTGGTVYFPKCSGSGYYKVSASLKPLARQIWRGEHSPRYHWQEYSESTCAIRAAASFTGSALIHNTSAPVAGVTIRNLALLGNGEAGTLDGIDFGPVSGSERAWRVEQCTLNAFGGAAICGYGWVTTIQGCHISRNGYGIRPASGADTASRFNDSYLLNNYLYFNYHGGLYLDGSGETGLLAVIGNRFERSGTTVSTTVDPNSNRDEDACGIYIARASTCTFVGNSTDANARNGVRIQGASHGLVNNLTFVGNLWKRDGTGDNDATMLPAVYVKDSMYVSFTGDVITYGDPNDGGAGRIAPQYGLEIDTNDWLTWNGTIQLESNALTLSNGIRIVGANNWQCNIQSPRQQTQFHAVGTAPANPLLGSAYFDTDDDKLKIWNGASWLTVGP